MVHAIMALVIIATQRRIFEHVSAYTEQKSAIC